MSLERLTPKPFMSQAGKQASNNSYLVRIDHGNWHVEGISKNPFNFKLSAKYADLFNGLIPGAELLQKTGNASLTTGIFSQKYFQGGNNIDINVEFRIYDDGKLAYNPVILGAKQLANMTVSDPINVDNVTDDLLGKGGDFVDKAKTTLKKGDLSFASIYQGSVQLYKNFVGKINERAVTLTIMNRFKCPKMFIQDVSVTYSSAQTHTRPLFGDFSVSLISAQAITRGGGAYGVNDILQGTSYNIRIDGLDAGVSGPIQEKRLN